MLELRQRAGKIVRELRSGERMVLTYRGQPVARLEPISAADVNADDPFYTLGQLADERGESLANDQIDEIIYGA